MKRRTWLLLLLTVVLVLGAGIGSAYAYFTTYSSARGGYIVRAENETEIHETALGASKEISIKNTGDYPVFVRVKIFKGSEITVTPTFNDRYWAYNSADEYYYYQQALEPGALTDVLKFDLTIPKDADAQEGDDVNVVVVYESVPAVFKGSGTSADPEVPDLETAWRIGEVTVIREGGQG